MSSSSTSFWGDLELLGISLTALRRLSMCLSFSLSLSVCLACCSCRFSTGLAQFRMSKKTGYFSMHRRMFCFVYSIFFFLFLFLLLLNANAKCVGRRKPALKLVCSGQKKHFLEKEKCKKHDVIWDTQRYVKCAHEATVYRGGSAGCVCVCLLVGQVRHKSIAIIMCAIFIEVFSHWFPNVQNSMNIYKTCIQIHLHTIYKAYILELRVG